MCMRMIMSMKQHALAKAQPNNDLTTAEVVALACHWVELHPGLQQRIINAKHLAKHVRQIDTGTFLVPSNGGCSTYQVSVDWSNEVSTCTCTAHKFGPEPCSHRLAAGLYWRILRRRYCRRQVAA